ncbi:Aste57867_10482 [Aphanomyces stellatus]|uniref:Aste57867_10482 protein n=1 Tax=Aphanomyces stellatus TaxID=120398 RepID=A0A485KQK3_9STRA|nr:hypothetical protein As57867_010442 [Aphanomyces stellatus]VFT87356.1 Aste57867_10482 [Aphanomyces stellatus]
MEASMLCKYVYKKCANTRAMKKDGELHRLCDYHRTKANALQKVYATKRRRELRELRRQMTGAGASTASPKAMSTEHMPYKGVKDEVKHESVVKDEDVHLSSHHRDHHPTHHHLVPQELRSCPSNPMSNMPPWAPSKDHLRQPVYLVEQHSHLNTPANVWEI